MYISLNKLFSRNLVFKRQSDFYSKYNPYKSDVTELVLNTKKPNIAEIKNIVQKYSPSTDVVDISRTQSPYMAALNLHEALTKQPDNTYRHEIEKKEMCVSPSLSIFPEILPNNLNNRVELINSLVHEGTHLFQQESCDRISSSAFFNSYLNQEKDKIRAKNTIITAFYLNRYLRDNCQSVAAKNKHIFFLPTEISEDYLDVNRSFMKVFKRSAKQYIQDFIFKSFSKYPKDAIDRKFIIRYIIYDAKQELEAYTNGAASTKEILGLHGHIDRELFANVAKAIIDACEDLLKRNLF